MKYKYLTAIECLEYAIENWDDPMIKANLQEAIEYLETATPRTDEEMRLRFEQFGIGSTKCYSN